MPITKNQELQLTIESLSNLGYGIAHTDAHQVVFVDGTVPGDSVMVKIIKVTSGYLVGKLTKMITPSANRLNTPFCDAPFSCGGCVYRSISYDMELRYKWEEVSADFRKAGLSQVIIEPVRTTTQITGYRNKGQYPVANGKDGLIAGFYANKTHRVVPTSKCPLHPDIFSEIVHIVCRFGTEKGWLAYDEAQGKGLLRHIYLRSSQNEKQILVCLVINGKTLPHADDFINAITSQFPMVCGIVLSHNTQDTNIILGDEYTTLWGTPYLTDILCGVQLQIAPAAFYQVNHDAAELLYGLAAEKAKLTGNESLLDLYCGIGSIGLSMAHQVKQLYGIEIVEDAVICAKKNAEINHVKNAHFSCGDASNVQKLLRQMEQECGPIHPEVVILDPPRKGTTEELISLIAERDIKKVVYISCNPQTLARDCAIFTTKGYSIGTVTPVDLFPRTGHVEMVCLLTKNK